MDKTPKNTRIAITESMVQASYDLGKCYKEGKIEFKEGINQLVDLGMNKNSASDYLYFYSKLMGNERFTRTTNVFATNYFLDRIHLEEGKDRLKMALHSLSEPIKYYEQKAKANVKSRRAIYNKYLAKLN